MQNTQDYKEMHQSKKYICICIKMCWIIKMFSLNKLKKERSSCGSATDHDFKGCKVWRMNICDKCKMISKRGFLGWQKAQGSITLLCFAVCIHNRRICEASKKREVSHRFGISLVAQTVKNLSACNTGDSGAISGLGRSPGEGNDYPLQYSCLENPMDRGAWWATVHGVTKSQTWPSD